VDPSSGVKSGRSNSMVDIVILLDTVG
jgi:hypothetical protein